MRNLRNEPGNMPGINRYGFAYPSADLRGLSRVAQTSAFEVCGMLSWGSSLVWQTGTIRESRGPEERGSALIAKYRIEGTNRGTCLESTNVFWRRVAQTSAFEVRGALPWGRPLASQTSTIRESRGPEERMSALLEKYRIEGTNRGTHLESTNAIPLYRLQTGQSGGLASREAS